LKNKGNQEDLPKEDQRFGEKRGNGKPLRARPGPKKKKKKEKILQGKKAASFRMKRRGNPWKEKGGSLIIVQF